MVGRNRKQATIGITLSIALAGVMGCTSWPPLQPHAAGGDARTGAEGRSQSRGAAEGRQPRSQTGGRQESGD